MYNKSLKLSPLANSLLLACAMTAITILISCSDDKATDSGTKTVGDVNDSSFQLVSEQFGGGEQDLVGFDWLDLLMDQFSGFNPTSNSRNHLGHFGRGSAGGDTAIVDSQSFDPVSGWIVFHATVIGCDVACTDTFRVVDSIRFRDLNNQPFIPQDSLNADSILGLDMRIHGSVNVVDSTDFVGSATLDASITADIIGRDSAGSDTIRVSATQILDIDGTGFDSTNGSCLLNVTQTSTWNNVTALMDDSTSECPLSGSAGITLDISADCTSGGGTLTFNDMWTVTATFNGGNTVTVVFENSTTRWEVTDTCDDNPPTARRFGRLIELGKLSRME